VGLGKQNFKRRVFVTKTLAFSYLKTSYLQRAHIEKTLAESLHYIETTSDPVVVEATSQGRDTTVKMIDLYSLQAKDYPVVMMESTNRRILLKRDRPEGYLIEDVHPEAIEKLKLFGFKMTLLNSSTPVECERYRIRQVDLNTTGFEKRNTLDVTTDLERVQILFHPGTYYVSTRQKNGLLLSELLEPEASNSFLSMRVIELSKDQEYHIYRVTKNQPIIP
jgi:hypothetical protein